MANNSKLAVFLSLDACQSLLNVECVKKAAPLVNSCFARPWNQLQQRRFSYRYRTWYPCPCLCKKWSTTTKYPGQLGFKFHLEVSHMPSVHFARSASLPKSSSRLSAPSILINYTPILPQAIGNILGPIQYEQLLRTGVIA